MRNAWALAGILLWMGAAVSGCDCNGTDPDPADSGVPVDGGGDADGGLGDGGDPTKNCSGLGEACTDRPCCIGECNVSGVCEQGPVGCNEAGEACGNGLDCCSNRCSGGVCSANQCVDNGQACADNSDCCTANCAGGTCAAIPGSGGCKVVGQACSAGSECCSTNCQGGTCVPAYTCRAGNDLCFSDLDCCSNLCSKNDGTAGFCRTPSGGCVQDGLPCEGGSTCCTRICSDPGTGATVCLPSTGCRMTGNSCTDAQACCGGGTNPNGTVQCVKETQSDAYGRCDNGQACNPVGNICGAPFTLPDGGTFSVPASQNCCDGKKEVCKLDSSGIPRCFGGGSTQCPEGYTGQRPCCIEENQVCQFKDQCCDGMPCVPGNDGILRCTRSTCIPLGNVCDPAGTGGDCCAPGDCLPAGEFGHICQVPGTGTDPDGGTQPDAGTCEPNGETCTTPAECCSGLCTNGVCGPPTTTCQNTGEVCTANGDCCDTLTCVIPSGSTSGTCQPGSGCSGSGQSCQSAGDCCSGLACLKAGENTFCDGTTACVCSIIIG